MMRTFAALASCVGLLLGAAAARAQDVVISQIYSGAGTASATYNRDYVELHNRTGAAINLSGYSIQYASATGTTWFLFAMPANTVIAANGYLLAVVGSATTGLAPLPISPDVTLTSSPAVNFAAAAGKVALVGNQSLITTGTACPLTGFGVVDYVGYGAAGASNPCVVGTAMPSLSSTTAALRRNNGCQNTPNASLDFEVLAPAPRNSQSAPFQCPSTGMNLAISAVPSAILISNAGIDTITWSIGVNNVGGASATNTVVSFPIPAGVTGISSVPAGAINGSTYQVSVGTIAPSGSQSVTITGTPTIEQTLVATFSVAATETDTDLSNNTASASTIVLSPAGTIPLKISQVYPGGGSSNSAATFTRDYVEIFNAGTAPVGMNGRSLQYQSETGTTWTRLNLPNASVPAGGRFLIAVGSAGTGGAPISPTEDLSNTVIALSANAGKIAIVNSQSNLAAGCLATGPLIIDHLGYGGFVCAEGNTFDWPAGTINMAMFRRDDGCVDTGDNSVDFFVAPPAPRNSASAVEPCGSPGVNMLVTGSAAPDPYTVGAGSLTYSLTVNNMRSGIAPGVVLTAQFPVSVSNVASTPAGTFDSMTGILTVSLPDVIGPAPTGATPVTITCDPTVAGTFAATISVTSGASEVQPVNNTLSLSTVVQPPVTTACNVADIVGIGGLPPPDGLLTGDDFNAFINAFAADDTLADVVSIGGLPPPDGLVTGDDFNAFINAFATGCP